MRRHLSSSGVEASAATASTQKLRPLLSVREAPLDRPETLRSAYPPAASACAPGAGSTFTEAWVRRVAEVDDGTLHGMMRYLVYLRRIKLGLGVVAFAAGAAMFGHLPIQNPIYALLIHGTLACCCGVPTLAIGSLAVRRLFLKEAERLGLSRSTSLLLLTRAERRARYMRPFQTPEKAVRVLQEAVRSWDEA